MEEICQYNGVILERDIGSRRKEYLAVDADTGEIMGRWFKSNPAGALDRGVNAVPMTVMIGREPTDVHAEFMAISTIHDNWAEQPDEILFEFWRDPRDKPKTKPPQHTGGKAAYLMLFTEKLYSLGERDIGTLLKLAKAAEWKTGTLIDKRTKKPLTFEGLLYLTGYSRSTLSLRLRSLREAGAITTGENGRYIVSKSFVRKG